MSHVRHSSVIPRQASGAGVRYFTWYKTGGRKDSRLRSRARLPCYDHQSSDGDESESDLRVGGIVR
jgi:hypothetical protein